MSKKGKKKHKGRMKEWKETHAWKHQVFPAPLFLGAFQNTTLHQRTRKKGPSAFKVYNILPPAVTITSSISSTISSEPKKAQLHCLRLGLALSQSARPRFSVRPRA